MKKSLSLKKLAILVVCFFAACIVAVGAVMTDGFARQIVADAAILPELSKTESLAQSAEISQQIAGEGMVLLKNAPIGDGSVNALPFAATTGSMWFAKQTRVSVFGKQSTDDHFVFGGSVSAGSVGNNRIGLYTSLENAGYGINPTLKAFYEDDERSGAGGTSQKEVKETPASVLQADTDIKYTVGNTSYKDAAIVVLSRTGKENGDMSLKYDDKGVEKHLLELSEDEKGLLKYVKSLGFTRTIVIVNAISFEYGFLDDEEYGIDAAIWVGAPGRTGLNALGKILSGSINPSGRTVDIAYADFTADPTYFSFSNNDHLIDANGEKMDNLLYTDNGDGTYTQAPKDSRASGYSAYNEGIYVGYRYYETIAADIAAGRYVYMNGEGEDGKLHKVGGDAPAKSDKKKNAGDWYDNNVVFPFGYGKSYTDFKWELVGQTPAGTALTADGTVDLQVKVTNTGSVAGKDVVQLYYNAPYYAGGIEKAYVNLGDYAKTSLLKPGKSEVVSLSVKVRAMASYDYSDANNNGFKGYELDAGDYNFFVGRNSNDAWRNSDGIKATYAVGEGGLKITHSEYTDYEVVNRFDGSDGAEANPGLLQEMSRADFVGTFPRPLTKAERVVSHEYLQSVGFNDQAKGKFKKEDDYAAGKPYEATEMPVQAETEATGKEEGLIRLYELMDVPKDDPKWDDFMDQFTLDQLIMFAVKGNFETYAVPELGVPRINEADGPYGFVGNSVNEIPAPYTSDHLGYYTSSCLSAATWNDELIEKMGESKGEEGLAHGINSIFAPGCNTHRSLFEGRNNEYYAEDPLLNGRMCAAEVRGLRSKGVIAYIKHFAVREEENEANVVRYITEQALREIYLKPFQIAVEEGKSLGIMASNNPIGETWWCGADYNLCTEVLRNEWGFEGINVTDWAWSEAKQADGMTAMVLAGTDKIMGNTNWKPDKEDPTLMNALRKTAKNICYAVSRSNAMLQYKGENEIYATGRFFSTDVGSFSATFTETTKYTYDRTYDIIGELPAGFVCKDGVISGNADNAAPGKYELTIEARVNGDLYRKDNLTIYIAGIKYEGGKLSDGKVGTQYVGSVASAESIHAGGLNYRLKSGSLPAGLSLDSSGTITGTPTAKGTAEFTVAASAPNVKEAETTFTLTVGDADSTINDLNAAITDLEAQIKALNEKITALEEKGGCSGSVTGVSLAIIAASVAAAVIIVIVGSLKARK